MVPTFSCGASRMPEEKCRMTTSWNRPATTHIVRAPTVAAKVALSHFHELTPVTLEGVGAMPNQS